MNLAKADTANPPRILGIKLIDAKTTSNVGDVLAFDVEYSGGNPGPSGVIAHFLSAAPRCLNGSDYASWDEKTASSIGYTNSVLGPYAPGKIRVYATVTSNCLNGDNRLFVDWIRLEDKSGLIANTQLDREWFGKPYPLEFRLNVVGGLYIPVGTIIENQKNTIFNLDFLSDSYLVDENAPTFIRLPITTPEGIYISFSATSRQNGCKQVRSFPSSHVDILLVGPGECEVTAGFNTRSEFSSFFFKKTINLISKAAADKAAADKAAADKAAADKAAADKAAAELKAKQAADAKATLKKKTITCVKGKLTKKVTSVKPKCPSGFKIKR
jgi:hypothetical protein